MKKLFLSLAAVASAVSLLADIPEPVLDLELNTGDVKTIKDLSANNCKVTVSAPQKFSWGDGPDGKVLQFSGDRTVPRELLAVTPPKNLKMSQGFTMRFTFKTPADYDRKVRYQLFQFGSGADKITGITVFLYWRNLHCRYGVKSGTGIATPATYPIQPDTWYDCVITYDKENVAVYINGKLIGKPVPAKINDINYRYMAFGSASGTGSGYSFKGLLSRATFYNKPLTAEEISNLE
ncbi:MAG: LamG domain-containing protein [Lentisphaeria bacterium]|nr:LamG domain-containing protein [Lentisphaeria bacterium]